MRLTAGKIAVLPGLCLAISIHLLVAFSPTDALAGAFHDGIAAYRAARYAEAYRAWTRAGRKGHTLAQYNLGIMYLGGRGIDRDYRRAMKWFERAAKSGFAPAFVNLAAMFRNGHGAKTDKKAALAHLIVAANALPPGKCREFASTRRKAISDTLSAKEILLATRMANETRRSGGSKLSYYSYDGSCFGSIALAGGAFGNIARISGFRAPEPKAPDSHTADRSVASDVAVRGKSANPEARISYAAGDRNYFAQVGSLPTNEAAQRFRSTVQKRHGQALGEHKMVVQEAQVERLGTVFRVRVGPFNDKATAKSVCRGLREKRQACFVVRQAKSAT